MPMTWEDAVEEMRDADALSDLLDLIQLYAEFLAARERIYAVHRPTAKSVSSEAHVEWRSIERQRNLLAHGLESIDWNTPALVCREQGIEALTKVTRSDMDDWVSRCAALGRQLRRQAASG